jgi:hypothetical protein
MTMQLMQGRMMTAEIVALRRRTGSRECGARNVLLCFLHCWHAVGTTAAQVYLFCSFPQRGVLINACPPG